MSQESNTCYTTSMYDIQNQFIRMKLIRVRTGPGKPGKSWNFVMAFSRTGKSWKKVMGLGKSLKSV